MLYSQTNVRKYEKGLIMRKCILEDKTCIECGKCDLCDLDSTKICDNCGKCIESDRDYAEILIDDILDED